MKKLNESSTVSGVFANTSTSLGLIKRMYDVQPSTTNESVLTEIFTGLSLLATKYNGKRLPSEVSQIKDILNKLNNNE